MDWAGSPDNEGKEGTCLVGKLSENTDFEERLIDVKIIYKLMIVGFEYKELIKMDRNRFQLWNQLQHPRSPTKDSVRISKK
jgi:hypothetical protein